MAKLVSEEEIIGMLEDAMRRAGGLREFGRRTGLSPGYLSDVKNGKAKPAGRLYEILGLERRTVIVRKAA